MNMMNSPGQIAVERWQSNITPKPSIQQRRRERQVSAQGIPQPSFMSPYTPTHNDDAQSVQPTPFRTFPVNKTPSRPIFDPNSPFLDNSAKKFISGPGLTPIRQNNMYQGLSHLSPLPFGDEVDDEQQGFDSSNIIYVDQGSELGNGVDMTGSIGGDSGGQAFGQKWPVNAGLGFGQEVQTRSSSTLTSFTVQPNQVMAEPIEPMMQSSPTHGMSKYPMSLGSGRPTRASASTRMVSNSQRNPSSSTWLQASTGQGGLMVPNQVVPVNINTGHEQQFFASGSVLAGPVRPQPVMSLAGAKRNRQVTHDGVSMRTMAGMNPNFASPSHRLAASSRSVSLNTLPMTDAPLSSSAGNAFTFRPLARMPARTVSSTSCMTESSWDANSPGISGSASNSLYMDQSGRHSEYPFGYMQHRRNISNLSGVSSAIETPALDYSHDSPAFSAVGTPSVGPLGRNVSNDYVPTLGGNVLYEQSPMFQQLGGLAIQNLTGQSLGFIPEESSIGANPISESCQDQAGGFSETDYLCQDPSQYQDNAMLPPAIESAPPISFALSSDPSVNHDMQVTYTYGTYSHGGASPLPHQGAWSGHADYIETMGMDTLTAQSVMQNTGNSFGSVASERMAPRHVSGSVLPSYPSTSSNSLQPISYPMPRSVSYGYVPIYQTESHIAQPDLMSAGMQQSISLDGKQHALEHTIATGSGILAPEVVYLQAQSEVREVDSNWLHVHDFEAESGNLSEPTAKRQRVKYPTVGKRLRPGPKPKPKTPRKQESVYIRNADGSLPFDPLVQSSPTEQYSQLPTQVQQPKYGLTLTIPLKNNLPLHPSLSSPLTGVSTSSPQQITTPTTATGQVPGEPASAIPKSYLESCYTSFMLRDPNNGGAPVKRYRCNIDSCTREFPRKSAIHSHIQTHLEDKPYVCPESECNAAFVRQHDLRRHVRIHSGTKPFPCPCGKGFARGDALMRHRQRGICIGSAVPMRKAVAKDATKE